MSPSNTPSSSAIPARNLDDSTEWPDTWLTMPHGIRVGRYIDPAFQQLEYDKLWSKVWQAAARLDEIQAANDYTVYEIGDQAVLIVRVDENTIKAYHNVCPHRGTALAEGSGTFPGGRIICPFHGWRWDATGKNHYILEQQEFRQGKLCNSDVSLKELKLEVYAGFIFINFDAAPQPFDEFIAPVRPFLDGLAIGDMGNYWWKSIPIPSNWKVAQEAFFETYHVPATHPQLEKPAAAVIFGEEEVKDFPFNHRNVAYDAFPNGHGRFYAGANTAMAGKVQIENDADPVDVMADRLQLLVDGMDAQVLQGDIDVLRTLRGKPIPEGSSLGGEYVKTLYAHAAAENRPMPTPTPEILGMWGGEVFIFPNIMILPHAGNAMIYRVRPNGKDPDSCHFEIMSTKTYPAAIKPPKAVVSHVTDLEDPEQVLLIPRQDLGNIPRMQKGLHSRSMRQTWLASHHEKMILNMHQEMDRYLQS